MLDTGLRPLTARSVVLSLLLGVHPPQLPVRDLLRIAEPFGIAPAALRVALTRMVSAGDLLRTGSVYRLSDRLVRRQRRQDQAVAPQTLDWHGDWRCVVITATGRSAADRAELRTALTDARLAELREGVWLRPDNLRGGLPELGEVGETMLTRPDRDPALLAARLWPLRDWAATATELHRLLDRADQPAARFTLAAAVVRHLLADPVLPAPLLPRGWPAERLRAGYAAYRAELVELTGPAG